MIKSAKIVNTGDYGGSADSSADWFVEVVFDDNTWVGLSEEQLKDAAGDSIRTLPEIDGLPKSG